MRTINKLKAKWWYGQSQIFIILIMIVLLSGILSHIVPYNIGMCFLFVDLLSFVAVLYLFHNTKYYYFTVIPEFYCKKYYSLNQKNGIVQNTACPRNLFLDELNSIIDAMPEGATYHASTHDRVIRNIQKHPLVKCGKVKLVVFPYSYEGNLKGMEKKLWNACCKTCTTEECRIRKAHNEHSKEKETFYAIELRKVAK